MKNIEQMIKFVLELYISFKTYTKSAVTFSFLVIETRNIKEKMSMGN